MQQREPDVGDVAALARLRLEARRLGAEPGVARPRPPAARLVEPARPERPAAGEPRVSRGSRGSPNSGNSRSTSRKWVVRWIRSPLRLDDDE
nr:hypothetical protein [Angustibacter aerolatus]